MNSEIVLAVEAYEIVLCTFVVAHEDILAMHAAIIFPPTLRLLDGLAFGMVVAGEWDMVFSEITEYFFLSFHNSIIIMGTKVRKNIHICKQIRKNFFYLKFANVQFILYLCTRELDAGV